jgi:hypothetical protein
MNEPVGRNEYKFSPIFVVGWVGWGEVRLPQYFEHRCWLAGIIRLAEK